MNAKTAIKNIINRFKEADKFNQHRPGETHLAIESFIQGFSACLTIAESLKLTKEEFESLKSGLGDYFNQFEDSATKTSEVC